MTSKTLRRPAVVLMVVLTTFALPVVDEGTPGRILHHALTLPESGTVRAPTPFALVGVTWPADAADPDDVDVEVRTSMDGASWGPWTLLETADEDGPDPHTEGTDVYASPPLWVREARYAQVRWADEQPEGAEIHFVDPGPDPVAPRLDPAAAAPGRPAITTRAGWGANESIRKCCPSYAATARVAFVHHTATGNSYGPGESAGIVRSIYAYHVNSNGWNDIGYNFLVDRYGQIFEGRAGGMERAVIGAHSQGFNNGSVGIAVIGSFSSGAPPQAAYNGLQALLAWKLDQHYIDPQSSTTVRSAGSNRYPQGQNVNLPNIAGHRDVGHTDCPGGALYNTLPGVRNAVAPMGDPKVYDPRTDRTVIVPNRSSARFTARFSSTVNWTADVRNGSNQLIRRFTGAGGVADFTWDGRDSSAVMSPNGRYRVRLSGSNANGAVRPATYEVHIWTHDHPVVDIDATNDDFGYWLAASDGTVLPARAARDHGSMGGTPLHRPVVGIAGTANDGGYWMVASDGGIFAFGNARFHGSMGGKPLVRPMVGMAPTPNGKGYWTVASDGGIFAFGNARFYGSMGGKPLDQPVVGMAATPSGRGYWLVAADGGIFAFGDARFHGSMGGQRLDRGMTGIVPTPNGRGYWTVASDGGVFSFGNARFHGSMGSQPLPAAVSGMARTPTGRGYWLTSRDGSVFPFGETEAGPAPGILPATPLG